MRKLLIPLYLVISAFSAQHIFAMENSILQETKKQDAKNTDEESINYFKLAKRYMNIGDAIEMACDVAESDTPTLLYSQNDFIRLLELKNIIHDALSARIIKINQHEISEIRRTINTNNPKKLESAIQSLIDQKIARYVNIEYLDEAIKTAINKISELNTDRLNSIKKHITSIKIINFERLQKIVVDQTSLNTKFKDLVFHLLACNMLNPQTLAAKAKDLIKALQLEESQILPNYKFVALDNLINAKTIGNIVNFDAAAKISNNYQIDQATIENIKKQFKNEFMASFDKEAIANELLGCKVELLEQFIKLDGVAGLFAKALCGEHIFLEELKEIVNFNIIELLIGIDKGTIEQLLKEKTISDELFKKIMPLFTIQSSKSLYNLNGALLGAGLSASTYLICKGLIPDIGYFGPATLGAASLGLFYIYNKLPQRYSHSELFSVLASRLVKQYNELAVKVNTKFEKK